MKIIIITIIISLVTSLASFWGYSRYQEHKKWTSWNKQQQIQTQKREFRERLIASEKEMHTNNQIDISKVIFVNNNEADITITIPSIHSTKRLLISDCSAKLPNGNYADISKNNEFTFKIKQKPCDIENNCLRDISIFSSHFNSPDEAYQLWNKEKDKYTDDAHKVFNDENNFYLYDGKQLIRESRFTGVSESNLCINNKEIGIGRDSNVSKRSPDFFIRDLQTNLVINWQKKSYCYRVFSGVLGFIKDACD